MLIERVVMWVHLGDQEEVEQQQVALWVHLGDQGEVGQLQVVLGVLREGQGEVGQLHEVHGAQIMELLKVVHGAILKVQGKV